MRPSIVTAVVASAAAAASVLIAAGPADAASSVTTRSSANTATPAQYASVAVGQTEAQVQQEMGSAGTFSPGVHELPGHTGFSLTWTDGTSLLGVRSFVVDFEGTGTSTPLVDSKDVDPLTLPASSL